MGLCFQIGFYGFLKIDLEDKTLAVSGNPLHSIAPFVLKFFCSKDFVSWYQDRSARIALSFVNKTGSKNFQVQFVSTSEMVLG